MNKLLLTAALSSALLCGEASAFSQITHKRIVIDAVKYMKAHPQSTNFAKLQAMATAAGISVDELGERLGQGAYDVDDFEDTFICGAVSGDCVQAPLWGAAESIVKYTSYWHFQNHTQGPDAHGNDFGGYDYDKLTVWGTVDTMAATWLKGDHLDDGAGGQTGWFGAEDSEYNSYGITEAHYRQGSSSNYGMYKDFEKIPFQPIDNLGQYWYNQFWQQPTVQSLGFVFHTTDLLQPHHVWTTSDLNHSSWESWVRDYYDSEQLNDSDLITAALGDFSPLDPQSPEIRPLLTEGGDFAYANGGQVLYSEDHAERRTVGRLVIPHAIAMVVLLLNHATNRF
ncbi:phospholipase [Shewanella sp. AS16]|uniref:phospholipase n=1 Tax=Shewanella sp. AS16 TaxID=2907625 RepID=UPI001F230AA5|nr:phospholipase [Shewanella sp. AS16]MCE9687570.1 phospholipase [Shewanella sp. AS16]